MAYNEALATRVRKYMSSFDHLYAEKKMFGGLSFLYAGKMACGVLGDNVIVRVLEPMCSALIEKDPLIGSMIFTGKPMKEFVMIEPTRIQDDVDLLIFLMLGVSHATQKALEERG